MKRLSFFLSLACLFQSAEGWSTGTRLVMSALVPVVSCPAIGEDYEKMVAKLDAIKAAIKDTGNCKNVTVQVDSLRSVLNDDRQKALDIVDHAGEAPLSKEDAEYIRNYSEALTKRVAILSDLFLNSKQCFEGDAPSPMSSFASFVSEASSLLRQVSGPWGAPIAMAGSVVAGFLNGLDAEMKTNAGYDFSKREQWTAYVQNLCTYNSYIDQVEHLLNPGGRIAQLRSLQTKLEAQVQSIQNICVDCKQIADTFNQNQEHSADFIETLIKPQVDAVNAKFSNPLGSYTVQNLGLRSWVVEEIKRMQKESEGDWGNASGQYVLTDIKLDLEQFLITREAPQFLKFQVGESQSQYRDLTSYADSEGQDLYNDISNQSWTAFGSPILQPKFDDQMPYLTALLLEPINWGNLPQNQRTDDLKDAWRSYHAKVVLGLRSTQTAAHVALSFCNFFRHTNQFTRKISGLCEDQSFSNLISQQIKLDRSIAQAGQTDPDLKLSGLEQLTDDETSVVGSDPIDALMKTVDQRAIGL